MLYICFILGFLVFVLTAPTPACHKLRHVALPVRPFPIDSSVEAEARGHARGRAIISICSATPFDVVDGPTAPGATLPIQTSFSLPRPVQHIAPRLSLNNSSNSVPSLDQNPRWSPSDISNVLFGCIASILGIAAMVVTYHFNRRHSQRNQSVAELDGTSISGTPFNGETLPLQDLTASYTSANGALAGANREGTECPATPGAAD